MQTTSSRLARSSVRIALSLATAVLVAACGGSGTPTSTTDDSSAGGTVTPQGTGSNTTPSNTPTGNTGTGGNTPSNAPTGNTETGGNTPSNGSSGASNQGGNTPGNGGGGTAEPPANPCGDLVPTFGTPNRLLWARGGYIGMATSSPWGQVALGRGYQNDFAFDLYSASGEYQGSIGGFTGATGVCPWSDMAPCFSWTSDGYVAVTMASTSGWPYTQITVWDNRGARVALGPTNAIALSPDGAGGTVALTRPGGKTELWWLDSWAHRIRSADIEGSPSSLIVNWLTHHVLTVETSSTIARARWYDGSGVPMGGWIELGSDLRVSNPAMHLLVDGSVAIAGGGRWRVVLRDGAPNADPAPTWLAGLSSTRLATIRDGRAYAALAANGSVDVLQILTPDGVQCSTLTVPNLGEPWHPARIDVGQDGTVLEILKQPQDVYCALANGANGCMVLSWPALLR